MQLKCETVDINELNLQCEFCGAELSSTESEQCRFCGGSYCVNCMATENLCNECYEKRKKASIHLYAFEKTKKKVSPSSVPCEIPKTIQPFDAETSVSHHRRRRRLL